ncbi:MAG: hypothetical protein LLG14_20465 [Nocardiaceae bacterium]|nr:hypothetical protein [Nocardiaceae bacterium]
MPNIPAWQQCRLRWNLRDYLGAGGSVVSTKFRYGVNTVHVTTGDDVNVTAVAAQVDYRWIDGVLCDADGNEGIYVIASEDPDIDPQGWSVSIEVVVSSGQKLKASIPSTPVGGDLDVSAYVGLPTPPAGIVVDPDPTMAANSDQRFPTQKAVRTYIDVSGSVPVSRTVNGHPLSADVTVTKADVGLNNVNNTADLNKPVSYSQAAADAAVLADAQSYADASDTTTLASAQSYADSGDAATLASAQSYADAEASSILITAGTNAAAGDVATLASAQSYADAGLAGKLDADQLDTDVTLGGGSASNSKIPAQLAVKTYVTSAINAVLNGAPGALDTLKELADAINDDANFAATVTTALSGKQPLDATLTALASLATGADKLPYSTGTDAFSQTDLTTFGRSLIDDPDAATARATLSAVSRGDLPISVKNYGAIGDGTTDDTAAIASALAAASSITAGVIPSIYPPATYTLHPAVYFPAGTYLVNSSIVLPLGVNLLLDKAAIVKAGSGVSGTPLLTMNNTSTMAQHFTIEGGVFDCNFNAQDGIYLPYFAHAKLLNNQILNPARHFMVLGDPGAASNSYEAVVVGLDTRRTRGINPTSDSYGIWLQNCSDSEIEQAVINGADIGVRVDLGGSVLRQVHVWNFGDTNPPTTCFEDRVSTDSTRYIGCYADTPALYGFRLKSGMGTLVGCRVYVGTSGGVDNTVTAVYSDVTGRYEVHDLAIRGASSSYRVATDFGGNTNEVDISGVRETNVVTSVFGSSGARGKTRGIIIQGSGGGSPLVARKEASGVSADLQQWQDEGTGRLAYVDSVGGFHAPGVSTTGVTGATNAGRFAGVTTSNAPSSGTFSVGDYILTTNGQMYVCVAAGTPGTWVTPRDVTGYSLLTTGQETIPRIEAPQVGLTWSSGSLRLSYFTARKSETETTVIVYTGQTAAGATPTLCRVGLYSVAANGDLTLVGSIANDTTLFAAASTKYTRSLSSSVALVAGNRYALGLLVVTSAAMPSFIGGGLPFSASLDAPAVAASLSGQTDLPSSITAASLGNSGALPYMVLTP